jgi:hypothetical protein
MIFSFKRSLKLPSIDNFSLEHYKIGFSLNRLVPGVDNVRYDVRLSPELIKSTTEIVQHLLIKQTQTHQVMEIHNKKSRHDLQSEFENHYLSVLNEALNLAKMKKEIQIDFLAQAALLKMIMAEIRTQFEYIIQCFRKAIRQIEFSSSKDFAALIKLKEQLSDLKSKRTFILQNAGIEFFQFLESISDKQLRQAREINFGSEIAIYADIFANPILHMEDSHDDFFMMDEYHILMGRRFDDPDRYNTLIDLMKEIFSNLFFSDFQTSVSDNKSEEPKSAFDFNELIKQEKNIDQLLNYFNTKAQYKLFKKQKRSNEEIRALKIKIIQQKKLFAFFYRKFNQRGLIKKIVASNHVRKIAREYCPPLMPQQIVQFLIKSGSRRQIIRQLKRSERFYGKSFSLKPLKRKVYSWDNISGKNRKEIFINYLKGFVRYHRDYENHILLKDAMDIINIATDEKIINLSRANHTLFEFLMPQEIVLQEKPIINHVIIKADVRGSTDITRQMQERGLNPASYFSLNFFDPITKILPDYGATKVFIEGDAIILAITEHDKEPNGWYSVARACGLSMKILSIVKRCNLQCRKNRLPVLELGIGISYQSGPPAFLFDENNKIMISPAINQADRLSGCTKSLKKKFENARKPFNIYIFKARKGQFITDQEEIYLRYNVNGIELSPAAFMKLTEEIEIKAVEAVFPEIKNERIKIYLGKYQTVSGKCRKILIREAQILEAVPENEGGNIKKTMKKYFEVVSNPSLYHYVEGKTN